MAQPTSGKRPNRKKSTTAKTAVSERLIDPICNIKFLSDVVGISEGRLRQQSSYLVKTSRGKYNLLESVSRLFGYYRDLVNRPPSAMEKKTTSDKTLDDQLTEQRIDNLKLKNERIRYEMKQEHFSEVIEEMAQFMGAFKSALDSEVKKKDADFVKTINKIIDKAVADVQSIKPKKDKIIQEMENE